MTYNLKQNTFEDVPIYQKMMLAMMKACNEEITRTDLLSVGVETSPKILALRVAMFFAYCDFDICIKKEKEKCYDTKFRILIRAKYTCSLIRFVVHFYISRKHLFNMRSPQPPQNFKGHTVSFC